MDIIGILLRALAGAGEKRFLQRGAIEGAQEALFKPKMMSQAINHWRPPTPKPSVVARSFDKSIPSSGWARFHKDGYEVSTAGDKRFSALNAKLKDGRSIEEAYQLDVKGYRGKGATDWRAGKGKPPVRNITRDQSWNEYKGLWNQWAQENPPMIDELRKLSGGRPLTDRFANTDVSQARALSEIMGSFDKPIPQRPSVNMSPKEYAGIKRHLTMDFPASDRVRSATDSLSWLNKRNENNPLNVMDYDALMKSKNTLEDSLRGGVDYSNPGRKNINRGFLNKINAVALEQGALNPSLKNQVYGNANMLRRNAGRGLNRSEFGWDPKTKFINPEFGAEGITRKGMPAMNEEVVRGYVEPKAVSRMSPGKVGRYGKIMHMTDDPLQDSLQRLSKFTESADMAQTLMDDIVSRAEEARAAGQLQDPESYMDFINSLVDKIVID